MVKEKLNNSFNGIVFEPVAHTYHVDGELLTSVSNSIETFYEHFDTDQKAIEYAERHGGDPKEIAAGWRKSGTDACDFGTQVHDFGEGYFYDKTLQPTCNHEVAIIHFWNDIPQHIIPIHAELQMYSKILKIAGTSDNLFFDSKRNGVIISDYKTNKNLYKNFKGKTMFEPFSYLLDMPLSHYELQLSTYQVLLEEAGIKVVDRWIIWLMPDGTYQKLLGTDYSVQIKRERLKYLETC